ncbi:hypothetical protein [uncultured Sphingomonas sp.]|uniref:hypothetical protein n=1 Tax=uncultured Sphingomonas sp. TaxID=158754 RepID=UPI00259377DE|nr:hypothetical protein [uncultured Sphingomonas sp.]
MKIKLWPDLLDRSIEASVSGDKLTLNGEVYDFGPLIEGFALPSKAVDSPLFSGMEDIKRIDGEICLEIRFPVTFETPEELRNPAEPIVLQVRRGKVKFPDTSAPKKEGSND